MRPNRSRTHNTIHTLVIVALATIPVFSLHGAPGTTSNADNNFVVRHARVFDGNKVIPPSDVWVENGKIRAVGANLKTPAGLREVDATGDTLLPGLIDSHTHAWGDALKQALVFGVTTELDMFTDVKFMQQEKKLQVENGAADSADLFSAGTLATAPGGHGTEYGFAIPTLSTPAEAQPWVDARVTDGSDYIKIVLDDASTYGGHRPTLDQATLTAVIEAAHQRGKLAVVHIGSQKDAHDAIAAGADGLVHLFADSTPAPDFAAFAATHHVFIIPTLTVLEGVGGTASGKSLATDPRFEPFLDPDSKANLSRGFPPFPTHPSELYAEQTVSALKAAHVPLLAGTDAPNPGTTHGASIHRELELLVRAGLTPAEALTAATATPAAAFHLTNRGEIAPGKRADLLLVKGDPTRDIAATRDIISVWKLGVATDRAAYRAAVQKNKDDSAKGAVIVNTGSGLISDFDNGKPDTKFGAGWVISTDGIMGGKSTADMKVVAGGANSDAYSLEVSGAIDGGLPFAWGGVMFSPGPQVFAPVNLSAHKTITFWAKGDGKTYRAMIFTESGGRIPAQQTFVAGPEWKRYSLPWTGFNGSDGHDVSAILFVGGPAAGKFDFQIDNIVLD